MIYFESSKSDSEDSDMRNGAEVSSNIQEFHEGYCMKIERSREKILSEEVLRL